jgi:SPP1 family predicted phage head-tail adaptor
MRSGNLDRVISLQAYQAGGVNEYGTPVEGWADFATLRAQLVQSSTDEYLRGYGEGAEKVLIFRTRFLANVSTEHRVEFDGGYFNIREIKQIGRRKGLDLRCEEVRS